MTDLNLRDVFDLPATVPGCVVKIQDFDDEQTLRRNVRDYVITDVIAAEMGRLVERIVDSCVRHEAGAGHALHATLGVGKSHFMSILGLLLENNPAIWGKAHPLIQTIQERHGIWLAQHPLLVVPVYMPGQTDLQSACYNAANERLAHLGVAPCEFSDADKIITAFRAEAGRYGDVVYQQFESATGISQRRFDRMAASDQARRDDLARQILTYRNPSRGARVQLYPQRFSDGMATLTRHAQAHGFAGVVLLIDDLIPYLMDKPRREYMDELDDLVAMTDNGALDRAVPLWAIVARPRDVLSEAPGLLPVRYGDHFPETTELPDRALVPVIAARVLRVRADQQAAWPERAERALGALDEATLDTLAHEWPRDDLRRLYPFYPALLRTALDVGARLGHAGPPLCLFYRALIERGPTWTADAPFPYAALFDLIFSPEGLAGGARQRELEAVRQTYDEWLAPLIDRLYGPEEMAQQAHLIVKTALLCGLSPSMRDEITVARILHLNQRALRAPTRDAACATIARVLTDLDEHSPLVRFVPHAAEVARGLVSVTLASGARLSDVLERVQLNWRQRMGAFTDLMEDLLGQPIEAGEIGDYVWLWRGSRRRGRVRFVDVAGLSLNDMSVADGDAFTLFVDNPFDADVDKDIEVIAHAQDALPTLPVGFWLPLLFMSDDRRDLDRYARLLEVESSPSQYLEMYSHAQRRELEVELEDQKRVLAESLRVRLTEVYLGPQATVRFLDPAITPALDAGSLDVALQHIADAVCDRLYPEHPRFPVPAEQASLRRLLKDFLVAAALGGGAVPRNPELDTLLTNLGEPLALAERGAQRWRLQPSSRYLGKLETLAAGRRVEVNKICQGLVEAFGFNPDLCDTFLLYLIRGRGYRALREGRPVPDVDYGGLGGLVLERGERLAIHEWAQVKRFIQDTWHLRDPTTELTVAAQDQLWRQLNAAARGARRDLDKARRQLVAALNQVAQPLKRASRLDVLDAAIALNFEAMREYIDPYDGLRMLLNWRPDRPGVTRETAAAQIARRQRTQMALDDLQTDTLARVVTLAHGGDSAAQAAWDDVCRFLSATDEEADLSSHIVAWTQRANQIIDAALQARAARVGPPPQGRVASAQVEVDGEMVDLDPAQVERALGAALEGLEGAPGDEVSVTLRVVLKGGEE